MKNKTLIIFGIGILLVISLALFVNAGAFSNKITGKVVLDNSLEVIEDVPSDVVDMRSYNSKTFGNEDGTYRTEIYSRDLFFYDGDQFVDLDKFSIPVIEKMIIPVDEIPEENVFDFGTYVLHKGVKYYLEEDGTLSVRDAKDKLIKALPKPFAIDSEGDVSFGSYVIYFDNDSRVLDLNVEIDRDWLDNAVYPIEVDPIEGLPCQSDCYDGPISGWVISHPVEGYSRREGFLLVGSSNSSGLYGEAESDYNYIYRGFLEFNTSSIPDDAVITQITLIVPKVSQSYDFRQNISIARFNHSQISNNETYPRNSSGNKKLFEDIGEGANGLGYYLVNRTQFAVPENQNFTEVKINLPPLATFDLQDNLENEFFALGFQGSYETSEFRTESGHVNLVGYFTSEGYYPIKLIVEYSGGPCDPEILAGDWDCSSECRFYYGRDTDPASEVISTFSFPTPSIGRINIWSKSNNVFVYNVFSHLWTRYGVEDQQGLPGDFVTSLGYWSPLESGDYGRVHLWDENVLYRHDPSVTGFVEFTPTPVFAPIHGYYDPSFQKIVLSDENHNFYSFDGSEFSSEIISNIGCFDFDYYNVSLNGFVYDLDYYTSSYIITSSETFNDYCINSTTLREYSCAQLGNEVITDIGCENGCESGKCISYSDFYGQQNYTISGNINVLNSCILDMAGDVNFYFDYSLREIFVYSGGKIYLSDSAGFNKWIV
jgi:hypothetical protein